MRTARTPALALATLVATLLVHGSGRAAPPPDGWRIRLLAAMDGLVDKGRLTLGASTAASNGYDDFDLPHPPELPSRYLDLVVRHHDSEPGWETQPAPSLRYQAQYDGPLGPGDRTLAFLHETDQAGPVTLSWAIGTDLELAQHFVTLRDLATGATVDMWAQFSYTFEAEPGPRPFEILLAGGRSAPPVAHDQQLATDEDTPLPVLLTATDAEGDPLTFEVFGAPAHGTLVGVPPSLTYVPNRDFHGADSFTFRATDGTATSNVATVAVTVRPVNDAPVADPQDVSTDEDVPVDVVLTGSDVDGDGLSFEVVTPPAHGALSGAPPDLTYTPAADYAGPDAFTFLATDGALASAPATVTVAVQAVNDPPLADFTVPGPPRSAATWDQNLASPFEGARVVAVTSEQPSGLAFHAVDDNPNTRWTSASGQPADQALTVELPRGPRRFDRVRLINLGQSGGQGIRQFEVRVSTTGLDDASFTTVLGDSALDHNRVQEFVLPAPAEARFVQLLARNNHGSSLFLGVRSFEVVDASLPGVPSYSAAPANAALLSELARVAAFSSQFSASFRPENALDGNNGTRWASASGQVASQHLTVELARGRAWQVDRVRLVNPAGTGGQSVRDFRLSVSATDAQDPSFVTVFEGSALDNTTAQEFVFPGGPVDVRFVKLEAVNNHGSTCCVSLAELQVVPVPGPPPSVSSYHDFNQRPENLLDGNANTFWLSGQGQVADQHVELRLGGIRGADPLIDRVRLQTSSGATAEALRDFEVLVSTSTDEDAAFTRVLAATAANTGGVQEFVFPAGPVRARYLRLLARNNHGSATFLRLATLEAITAGSDGNVVSLPGLAASVIRNEWPSLTANGATVVRFSSAHDANQTPAAMLDHAFGLPWRTTALANQSAVIQLAGGTVYTLEAVRLSGRVDCCTNESVRDFEVWVSSTTDDDSAFSLALQGAVVNDGTLQTFTLPGPVPARYVKYVPLNNHGHATAISTSNFEVRVREAGGVVAASSQLNYQSRAEFALDGGSGTLWQTASGATTNQSLTLAVSGGARRRLYGVRIWSFSSFGPRDFEVRLSDTPDPASFTTVLTSTLPVGDLNREVPFPSGFREAAYVQFVWRNGYGPSTIAVRELEVLEVPDSGAVVVGVSSQASDSFTPRAALDVDRAGLGWVTASGQNADQWFKVLLPGGLPWLVDQLALQPRADCCDDQSPRDFELQVSTTTAEDAAFATVLAATLRNDRQLQFFSFPAASARYLRLLVRNNYGSAQVGVQAFWALSPQLGGPSARFLDLSRDPDGTPAAFAWQFGDGAGSAERDPGHIFSAPGTYPVTLTVTDAEGGSASRTVDYRVFGAPQADFGFNPAAPNEGQNVFFSDLSTDSLGAAALRRWEWGDGTPGVSNQANPVHSFADDGSYAVSLAVTNARGISSTITRTVPVANVPPVANAGADRSIPWGQHWNDAATVFDAGPADRNTLSCSWDFGDGQTAEVSPCNNSTVRVVHPYAVPGTYVATLEVRDDEGAASTDQIVVTVTRHSTGLLLCPPQVGVAADQREVEVTATLTNASVAGISMAGRTVRFTVDGQGTDALTDADGVARVRFLMAADSERAVTAAFAEDAFHLGSAGAGTARVARLADSAPDSRGSEYWLGFPGNLGASQLSLFVTGDAPTSGTVAVPALNFCGTFAVTPGQVTTVALPAAANLDVSELVQARAVHLTALDEVSVYGLSRLQFTTDAYLGLPGDILGTEHVVLGYRNSNIVNASQFAVVAAEDGTAVSIRPSVTTGSHPAGVPYSVTLQRGQAYMLRNTAAAPADLSGTIVATDKPVAVFGGHQCANVPGGVTFCDYVVEQIPPTATWGRSFVTMPLATRLRGDTFRFVAAVDGTRVSVNGVEVVTLARAQVHERIIEGPSHIAASEPILVAQYSNGTTFDGVTSDPFMMLIPPFEQFQSSYTVTTPATGFAINHVNLVAPASAVGAITVDGTPVPAASFVPIGTSGFAGAQVSVAVGSHTLAGPAPFGAFMYGFADFDSYGYAGGMSLSPVARVATLTLTPETETSLVGVERCVTAAVADEDGAPLEDIRVDFAVTGAHPRTAFTATDAAGEAVFCYTGVTAGADTITASVGEVTDAATKVWTSNRAPVADDLAVATDEDTPVALTLTAADADGDPLTFVVVSPPAHGSLAGTAPHLTYTPAPDFHGADTFVFEASDGQESDQGTVTITVAAVNDRPLAQEQSATTDEDTPVALTLTATDVEGDPLTFRVVDGPGSGSLSGTPPALTYAPAPDFHGSDAFTFVANDGQADSDLATVTVTVRPLNDPPAAVDQALETDEDNPVAVTLAAEDPDGDVLAFAVVSPPLHGALSGTAPALVYTPTPDFHGVDSFVFEATDGQAAGQATITITVQSVNDPPLAADQSVSTDEDTPVPVTLLASDVEGDALAYEVVTGPAHGTLSGTLPELIYTPAADFHGADGFTFVARDGALASNVAAVTLTVRPVGDPPVAEGQEAATDEDTPLAIRLGATDADGDPLTFTIVSGPSAGTLGGTPPDVTYAPAANFHGTDSFTFKAADGQSDSNVAAVTITVRPVNDPPDCTAVTVTPAGLWPPNHTLRSVTLGGLTDLEGDPTTLTALSVHQDEPVDGTGDGNTSPDATLSPLRVRAERAGHGDGRVYHVRFRGADAAGGSCEGEVRVCVPHDQGRGETCHPPEEDPAEIHCGDGGPLYDSTRWP